MIKKNLGILILLILISSTFIYADFKIINVQKINTSKINSNLAFFNNNIYYLTEDSLCAYNIKKNSEEKICNFNSITITTSYFDKDNNEIKATGDGLKNDVFPCAKSIAVNPKTAEIFFATEFDIDEENIHSNPLSVYSFDLKAKKINQIIKPKQKEIINYEWDMIFLLGLLHESLVYIESKKHSSESRLVINNVKANKLIVIDSGNIDCPIGIQSHGNKIAYPKYDDNKSDFRLFIWDTDQTKINFL